MASWKVRRSQVDWFTRFFGIKEPVPVMVGEIPGPAWGVQATRGDCYSITLQHDITVQQANFTLAHELIHVRQTIKKRWMMVAGDLYEQHFGYRDNPVEREATEKGTALVMAGVKLVEAA